MTLCECGCDQEVKEGNRFIRGHHVRGRKLSDSTKKKLREIGKGNQNSLGHKHTDETKKKIGSANKGRKRLDETKQKMSEACKGRKHSEKTKKKISDANKGENGPNWQGGISFEPYCRKFNNSFKESIRDKFNRKCFLCGEEENGRKLAVHHVQYDKNCLCVDVKCEFVPLCISCHGKTNHNRDYWEELILAKLGLILIQ